MEMAGAPEPWLVTASLRNNTGKAQLKQSAALLYSDYTSSGYPASPSSTARQRTLQAPGLCLVCAHPALWAATHITAGAELSLGLSRPAKSPLDGLL